MDKIIQITPEEAMLVDWVLTMHTYDSARAEQLTSELMLRLRKKIASVITHEDTGELSLLPEEISYLLISIPITFRFSKEDVGYSLKRKLLATLTTPKIIWEVEDGHKDSPGANNTKDSTESSP